MPRASRFQQRGEGEARDGIHIAAHQHGLAQRRVHGRPLHGADLVGLGEQREGAAARIEHGRAQLLAGEVGRLGDAAFLERHHRGRRVVVDHHHGHGLVGHVRVVGLELHQRRDVGKAQVIGARGHALHHAARAAAGIDRDIQARVLEVALGHRLQEEGGRPLEAPVQLELQRRGRVGLCLGRCQAGAGGQGQDGVQEQSFLHGGLPL